MRRTQFFCYLLGQFALPRGQIALHCEDFAVPCELLAGPFSQHIGQPPILQALLRAGVDSCLEENTWKSANLEAFLAENTTFSDMNTGHSLTHPIQGIFTQ